MKKIDLDVPADTESVTLNLKKGGGLTLRSVLPAIYSPVMLCVNDRFSGTDVDQTIVRAKNGDVLLQKLERSRVLEGEALLDLVPEIRVIEPTPVLTNGSIVLNGESVIQLWVTPPRPDEDD